ncbi:MAG: prephenate dehydratase [Desulfobacterales bacterium]|nr:prephenate dehydratase [Desulfobacterales bacterium]
MIVSSQKKIAFQGVTAAHTDLACRKAYPGLGTLPCHTFDEVFDAVETSRADMGMIPIENSQAGRVAEIHNLWPGKNVFIVAEHFQAISHHLFAPDGATLSGIKDVYSHPQALMQCRHSLKKMAVNIHNHMDTALAAQEVAQWNNPTKAALASELAGEIYNLQNIQPHMEDSRDNTTVFVTIARQPANPEPAKQPVITSLLFSVRNIPAALYKALGGFATNAVNLIKLESYIPVGVSPQTAKFLITFEGHTRDRNVQLALEELGFYCDQVTTLGEYYAAPERF